MKNTIKMSLVAAVAVAGLSSTAAAKPLEEAIKNVDISGTMVYRYDEKKQDIAGATATASNNYKIATSLKSKVNDYVTATVRVVTGHDLTTGNTQTNNGDFASLPTNGVDDQNPTVQVSQANFTVSTDAATVIVGKQGLATPWTVAIDSDSNEQTGTGALALVPVGPVTVAAGYFNQTNLGYVGKDIATVAVLGSTDTVSYDAWYLDLQDTFSTYTVGAKAKLGDINVDARYASLELDSASDANTLLYIKTSGKFDKFGFKANVAMTGEDGGLTALDGDAKTTILAWNVNTHNKADALYYHINGNMDAMDNLNVALNYASVDYDNAGTDQVDTELFTQITYKMSSNLSTYFRYAMINNEVGSSDTDSTRGRLQVEYKF